MSMPWYCVNVGGRVIDMIDPSLPCAVVQNVGNQVGAAAAQAGNAMTQLQGLTTDFTWLQGNWSRMLLAIVAVVIVGLGFWILSGE